ncbi:hypothetical protein MCOR25_001117 [Pyricularia grisea]|uniref:Uncharacterized protein n=1 Tax=Pyricularia grisea TaxID=148305 RepID=A0A6P8AN51_PYRGI|nr:uncharacterized protein PgNI_11745 [Pyricularia grisea]KAI6381647.1 hypothetical protein MCOR25_001117 [Pyricularia grisea]TLD03467.1 hypothetical protein PgNI_11745 [Pyricularia grisea]
MSDANQSVGIPVTSYKEVVLPGYEILPPTMLTIKGQEIHATEPEARLLYRLSLGITTLSEITTDVQLSRVESTKGGSERQRHIYDLKHMRSTPGGFKDVPAESPRYYIKRASRLVPEPAAVGIKKKRSLMGGKAEQVTAVPVDLSGKASEFGIPTFVKKAEAIFTFKGPEWVDNQGKSVAVMYYGDKEDKVHSLVLTASLTRAQFEILVALWCCHVWEFSVANAEKIHEGSAGLLRKLKQGEEYGYRWMSGPAGGGGASTAF